MAGIEPMTITLPLAMAAIIKGVVEEGDDASSEVIREALHGPRDIEAIAEEGFEL